MKAVRIDTRCDRCGKDVDEGSPGDDFPFSWGSHTNLRADFCVDCLADVGVDLKDVIANARSDQSAKKKSSAKSGSDYIPQGDVIAICPWCTPDKPLHSPQGVALHTKAAHPESSKDDFWFAVTATGEGK